MALYDSHAIAALDIGPEYERGDITPTQETVGLAVAGSLLAVDESVSDQHHFDVVASLLLAQLAANAKADRHGDTPGWYRVFQQTLDSIGWVNSASLALTRYLPTSNARYTVQDVVIDLYKRKTLKEELASSLFTAFRADSNERAHYVFEGPSHSGGNGNFQVALAVETDENTLTLHTGRFVFSVPAYVPRILDHQFNAVEAKFSAGYTFATLNESVYAKVRDAIRAKLGDRFEVATAKFAL